VVRATICAELKDAHSSDVSAAMLAVLSPAIAEVDRLGMIVAMVSSFAKPRAQAQRQTDP
jgi:hypothetical protein